MRRLSLAGARLWNLYPLVERYLGFAASREATVTWNLAFQADYWASCQALGEVEEEIDGRRVCIAGPAASRLERCDTVIAAGESGLAAALALGARPLVAASDLDGSPPVSPAHAAKVILAHVHADNLHLAAGSLGMPTVVVLTAQVPVPGILSPYGFADGDRAVLTAVALGASEVIVEGVDLNPSVPKHRISVLYIMESLSSAGFRVKRRSRFHLEAVTV